MNQKMTFYIMSHSGARIRELTISKHMIRLMLLFLCGLFLAFVWMIYDYTRLFVAASELPVLHSELMQSEENLGIQRQQIQIFAKELNLLKSRIMTLSEFEQKIRTIANLQTPEGGEGIFGLGGPQVEDLDTRLELSETHASLIREMHDRVVQLDTGSLERIDGFETLLKSLENQRNLLAVTPAIRPADGWVTSRFGYRTSPFTGKREFHSGLDIANRIGTAVVATADGVVSFAGDRGAIGLVVTVDHGHGLVTRYGHLHKALVKAGQKVRRGEVIAKMGNSGRSTGPHVHYEVRLNGVPVNPGRYILD
ncbi:M23 family metallopeptidase [Desulfobotulus sp.]|jgi:murein DD-endopeptidase MepM/ murein hydrolase activator NlpD|uniref:M23 family metallopeptidase n=1 Tax=Desulfobotulus sp. TaxID=1940337 RepID=UPI002A36E9E2|nr:M23 family metallopeptidase [Desulfobotulus sp.]MDY0162984.1 M23 family metallopeptidase [Desulfobotulus sp.]